jgi:hypothetical protein
MLKTLSFLRSLRWITLRKPRDLSHIFGEANSVALDIGRFFRINLHAQTPMRPAFGKNLSVSSFGVLCA